MLRPSGRNINQLREVDIQTGVNKYAEGSCLISMGDTQVLCTATVEEKLPQFLKNSARGWVTAEYNMLPRATSARTQREREKQNSRGIEIQRLVGRSLRAGIDLEMLGTRQIIVDCDVIQADGGTRCASVTGGFVALHIAIQRLIKEKKIHVNPIKNFISAVSCGFYRGSCVLDLDYDEDSSCDFDINFVLNDKKEIVEIQGTGENAVLPFAKIEELYSLALGGCEELYKKQQEAIKAI
ncbi:MAG: ribonuclease PH [Rickettsiales bacterium]|jgi:ribonuclease PH|nr:ribonuclease PH [Rickettsiales bacterium]